MIENERDKKRKIAKRTFPFQSRSLSFFLSRSIIRHIISARAYVEDRMPSVAQRIAFSGGGGEVKQSPIKRGGKKSGQKGPFLSRRLCRSASRGAYDDERAPQHSLYSLSLSLSSSARMRAASHLRIMRREIEYLSWQKHFPGTFLPRGDPWPRGPAHPGPRARGHGPALGFLRTANSVDLKVDGIYKRCSVCARYRYFFLDSLFKTENV